MSNTIIQLRRSNTSATPGTTLFAGELAYSYNTTSQSLFIGANAGVGTAALRIGGVAYAYLYQANTGTPGAQASNATVITDGNAFVYNVFSTGLVLGATSNSTDITSLVFINSISNVGNSSQLGANASGGGKGTELVTSAALVNYISTHGGGGSPGGSNTQIQFNNSAAFGGDADFTFDIATNIVALGNSTTGSIKLGTGTANIGLGATSLLVQSNSTVNSIVAAANLSTSNSTDTSFQNPLGYFAGVSGANSFQNTTAFVVQSNTTVNTSVTPTTIFSGNSTINLSWSSSKLVLNGATNVDATSAFLKVQQAVVSGNLTVQGNLSVTGTLTSIDSTNIVVQDPVIVMNDSGVTTDTADAGYVHYFGNSTVTQVGGIIRKNGGAAAGYANTFMLFTTQTAFTNTTSTLPIDANLQLGILQSWLYSSANSTTTGKLVSNTSGLTITANSTWPVAITANSLTLTTQLPVGSGGTGVGSVTVGGVLLGNSTSALVVVAPGSNGQVLQVLNSAGSGPENIIGYSGVDGGTF